MMTLLCLETSGGILLPRYAVSFCRRTRFLRHTAPETSIQYSAKCRPELIRIVLPLFLHFPHFDVCEQIHFLPSLFLYILLFFFVSLFLFHSFVFTIFLSFSFVPLLFSLGFRPFFSSLFFSHSCKRKQSELLADHCSRYNILTVKG